LTRIFATQVVTSSGEEVFFKIKRNTKLSKLQGAYAAKVGKDVSSIRWAELVLYAYLTWEGCAAHDCRPFLLLGRLSCLVALWTHFALRFLYEGDRITEDATPASLDMEDNGLYV
jgi:hypothetical protein